MIYACPDGAESMEKCQVIWHYGPRTVVKQSRSGLNCIKVGTTQHLGSPPETQLCAALVSLRPLSQNSAYRFVQQCQAMRLQ
jgi:hypothetical protein